jgi:hypothetical protein
LSAANIGLYPTIPSNTSLPALRSRGPDTTCAASSGCVAREDVDEPLGCSDRKQPEQQRVDDGEERGVETDADRQRRTATSVNAGLLRESGRMAMSEKGVDHQPIINRPGDTRGGPGCAVVPSGVPSVITRTFDDHGMPSRDAP